MDSITQAALGGALGGAVLGHRFGRAAVVAGALLGTLPDMDVLIDYGDAVANFSQHRGFSHSLLVLVPLAVVLAALLSRWQRSVSFRRWLTFTGAILITHPLLDAFTTYGTQLLWPLGPPVAWHTIFIIDPLYTLPLLVAVIIALVRPPAIRALTVGLALSSLYLAWSLAAQQWVDHRVHQALAGTDYQTAPRCCTAKSAWRSSPGCWTVMCRCISRAFRGTPIWSPRPSSWMTAAVWSGSPAAFWIIGWRTGGWWPPTSASACPAPTPSSS